MSATYVALLRGVNVGGNNKLAMKDLTSVFVEAGCNDVRTYIQSGNVIFQAEPNAAAGIPDLVTARIASRFGIRTPVVLRTSKQIDGVVANNPFLLEGAEDARLYVMFLADHPSPERVESLDPDRSPPDRFVVHGQDVYLRIPNGAASTKLTNGYFDSKLNTTSTMRNWRTVTTLLELMKQSE
jgi:uncharacterized protein (DUF1697 family)